ncbi:hypothetical protein QR680_018550 [Steinernema hermaphroditum]|uniref:Uncharacterized protein n=1 Tax=Steinernema hermaphroditum TaxID=289476 RepID=A0AA39LQH9_9BILA|nr:hypothetical protein QR680_018550 [Steinernema hermaphroditum]
MSRWWSVVLVIGVLVAWALAEEECTKGCDTGYKCEIEQGELTKSDSGPKDDPEDRQNVFANKSFDQAEQSSGKSRSSRIGDAL